MLNIVLSQCQHVGIIALNESYIINPPLGGSHMFHSILILFHAHTYSDTVPKSIPHRLSYIHLVDTTETQKTARIIIKYINKYKYADHTGTMLAI